MVIVPSIDVRSSRAVAGGAVMDMTPSELARHFVAGGARELHLVDLDMAEHGEPANLPLLAHIARTCGVPARLAGGVSSVAFAREATDAGFSGVLFSSAVFGDDDLLREIASLRDLAMVEIEAKDGWLAPRGGAPQLVETARGRDALAAADAAARCGVRDLYVIDLATEGSASGSALGLLGRLRAGLGPRSPDVRFHTGGGLGSLDDVRALAEWGVVSAVVGRALALGRFTIHEAQAAASGARPSGTITSA